MAESPVRRFDPFSFVVGLVALCFAGLAALDHADAIDAQPAVVLAVLVVALGAAGLVRSVLHLREGPRD